MSFGGDLVGIRVAEVLFWVLCAAIAVVAVVFVVVQYGPAANASLWLINQGRTYVEAPRWAALVVAVFGLATIALGIWNALAPPAQIVNYWALFWVGVLTAFIALWAAIYRPTAEEREG